MVVKQLGMIAMEGWEIEAGVWEVATGDWPGAEEYCVDEEGSRMEAVLRGTQMPAVLVEAGYLVGAHDVLIQQNYRDHIVSGIYNGVVKYLNGYGTF